MYNCNVKEGEQITIAGSKEGVVGVREDACGRMVTQIGKVSDLNLR